MRYTSTHLWQVAYCKHHASFPPTPGLRGHEKCWLNPFFVPTLLLRVKAGNKKRKKKRDLCFSHSAANKRGWDWEKRTHTPPAIKSLEFVLSAQNPQRPKSTEETSRLGGKYYEGVRKTRENENICHKNITYRMLGDRHLIPRGRVIVEDLIISGYWWQLSTLRTWVGGLHRGHTHHEQASVCLPICWIEQSILGHLLRKRRH